MKEVYHFIGIGGIGMSGLAHIMLQKNYAVSGSDILITPVVEALIKQGAIIHKGQSANNISSDMRVIFSSDIKADNPEYLAAIEKKCQLLHRSDLLAKLISDQKSLAVAGTHGKTTTSALLAAVLFDSGYDPSFAIGGVVPQFQGNSRFGQGEFFAFEADESDRTFLKYHPYGAIITNIDHDHLVNYEDNPRHLVDAFQSFADQVQSKGHLFWCGDDHYMKEMNLVGESYGTESHCHWRLSNIRQEGFKSLFDLQNSQGHFKNIELALVGLHNAFNASGVFALAMTLGIPEESVRQVFSTFQGILRRCERRGSINNILFLDDYAHHPTEIKTTLLGIRRAIGNKRLVAVFQPHRYSRTQECQGLFGASFEGVDVVFVTDIYGAGETPIPTLTGEKIMQEIKNRIESCHYVPRTALSRKLMEYVQSGDVVVTLGAGDVTKVSSETLILLENRKSSDVFG